jgi:ABC-type Fe3+ transport system permease subunit
MTIAVLRKIMTSDAVAVWIARLVVAVLTIVPVAVFVVQAVGGLFAPAGPVAIFSWGLLARSSFLAASVAVVSGIIGGVCGTVAGRLSRPWAAMALFAFIAPLAAPAMVHAYVWRNAALSLGLLGDLFVEGGSDLVNLAGVGVSMISALWTVPALAAFAVAAGPARRAELEARPFAPAATAARKILIPSVMPAVAAASALVFILAFGEYGSPAMWQVNTFPAHVMSIYASMYEPRVAAAAALAPAVVTGLAAAAVMAFALRAAPIAALERANVSSEILWRPGAALKSAVGALVAALVAVPTGLSVWWAARSWTSLAAMGGVIADLGWSMAFGCAAALVAAVVAAFAASAHWTSSRLSRAFVIAAALAAFFLPAAGAGLAVKQVALWRFVPASFSSTPAALIYAHAGRFLAVPLVLAALGVSRIGIDYRRLAAASGVRGLAAVRRIGLPVTFPALIAGVVVVAVLAVAELPMAMLLSPPGRPPVAVDLFNLMHYARQSEAFAVSVLMSVCSAACVLGVLFVTGRLWKQYLPTN